MFQSLGQTLDRPTSPCIPEGRNSFHCHISAHSSTQFHTPIKRRRKKIKTPWYDNYITQAEVAIQEAKAKEAKAEKIRKEARPKKKASESSPPKTLWHESKLVAEANAEHIAEDHKKYPHLTAPSDGLKEPEPYTNAELADLRAFAQAYSKQHQSTTIDNARKQAQDGVLATTLEHAVMMWATWAGMADTFGGPKNRKDMTGAEMQDWWQEQEALERVPRPLCDLERATMVRVAYHIAWAVRDCDEHFFKRIYTVLKAKRKHFKNEKKKDGRVILSNPKPLEARQLDLHRKRSRGFPAHSLACCFPSALSLVMNRRLHDFGEGMTRKRITRSELMLAVQEQRHNALRGSELINVENAEDGCFSACYLEDPNKVPLIGPSELSRWITKAGCQRFMAEQPIAHKRRK